VSSINIGPINKKDVMRANAMIERGHKKYGVILAFDVPGQHPHGRQAGGGGGGSS
jgi:translation initiation factor IF-2